jgi:CRP/FNR family transcriptional regulator, anaerobic regulatory protein
MNENSIQTLIDRFVTINPLSNEAIEKLETSFQIKEYRKHERLLNEGEVCNYMYYVLKGIVRVYYNIDGIEVTSRLFSENYFVTSYMSFISREAGIEFIEAYEENTVIAKIHYNKLQELYKQFPEINYVSRALTELSFYYSEERTKALRKTSANHRVQFFIKRHPELIKRVAARHIASYLGLSEETYSRVKKDLYQQ